MEFETAIRTYFHDMRHESLSIFAPVGVVLAMLGLALILRGPRDTFTLWAGGPLVVVGLTGLAAGLAFAQFAQTNLPLTLQAHAADPAALIEAEAARIAKILRDSYYYFAGYGAIMVAAFVLLFGVHRDWSIGLALPLMALAAMSFCCDIFIHKRTVAYLSAIEAAR